ncbi:hypothetical protein EV699_11464 [Plasticicumulans lactativorans]|uniref:Aminomethyltransferase folate-binding domain-containing protein n=1 Tax=Plasticicumulans lactativorans TaxID=1133106 RepID=A0A4V6NPI9_9GAMM|nr:folate-binding protein YgfZ [Plasticicumulans lactativorans]TCO80420.1 hypothetical protein EV699_11464 [Plasticicumulans lactativorans]
MDCAENPLSSPPTDDPLPADFHCPVLPLAAIRVDGPERSGFLQGQLTHDLRLLGAGRALRAAQCSPKGRVLALARLFERDGAIFLLLPETLVEGTLKRLRMYVLRARVTLAAVAPDELRCSGVAGERAAAALAAHCGAVPAAADGVVSAAGLTVIRERGPRPRFSVLGAPPALDALHAALAAHAPTLDADAWRLAAILAGEPQVHPATVEAFVPQMLNLDALDGVSFAKGCYTGQEIIARAQYLGRIKRRLLIARVTAGEVPAAGTGLWSPAAGEAQEAGTVVEAAPHPAGGYVLSAVVPVELAAAGGLRVGSADGPPLQPLALPYALPEGGAAPS